MPEPFAVRLCLSGRCVVKFLAKARRARVNGGASRRRRRRARQFMTAVSQREPGAENGRRECFGRLRRQMRYNFIRLFRIKAASEHVARGFALGIIVNFLPTFGAGVLISGFVARTLGGNVVAGVIGGASLSWAWPFLFYLNIRVGSWLLHKGAAVNDPHELSDGALGKAVWGQAFSVGVFVNCLVLGGLAYLLLRVLYREVRGPALRLLRRRIIRRRSNHPTGGQAEPIAPEG